MCAAVLLIVLASLFALLIVSITLAMSKLARLHLMVLLLAIRIRLLKLLLMRATLTQISCGRRLVKI